MADDKNINDAVSQLVDQLQNNTMNSKQIQADAPLQGQDLEKFLLEYSGKLIKGSVDFVEDLKTYVASAPTAEDVSAMATLVSSSAAAIETLNKILIRWELMVGESRTQEAPYVDIFWLMQNQLLFNHWIH